MHLPEGIAHLDSFSSQAACGSSHQRTASSLSSVDQTAHFFLATPNPRRPWQKQVRACGRKRPLTTTTHYPQTAGETAGMHENGSGIPRLFGTGGSDLERSALHRSTRDEARVGIESSSAFTGSAGQRPLLTNRRSPPKRLP